MRLPSKEQRQSLATQAAKYNAEVGEATSYLTSRGIGTEAIKDFQLGYSGAHDNPALAHRLTIPYLTPVGPWQIKYRCITSHDCKTVGCPKYTYETGMGESHLYNAQALITADRVVITEGELDAVAIDQAGGTAVAYSGTQRWLPHFRWLFDSCDEVIIVADGDLPKDGSKRGVGEIAASKVYEALASATSADIRVVVLPVGHDSNSLIQEEGGFAFLDRCGWFT